MLIVLLFIIEKLEQTRTNYNQYLIKCDFSKKEDHLKRSSFLQHQQFHCWLLISLRDPQSFFFKNRSDHFALQTQFSIIIIFYLCFLFITFTGRS